MEDRTGNWLAGRYRLDHRLSEEITGDRYDAWDGEYLLRIVVYILAPSLLEAPDAFARYERQVHEIRRLASPGLVPVRGIARDDATVFLILDDLPGRTLAMAIRERNAPFTPTEAVRILRPVAAALDALHATGIAHRHVSPATIALAPEGIGILTEPAFAPPAMDGALFGSSFLLSPEQYGGRVPTGASDTYLLGAVLYEMLTGSPPFTGARAPQGVDPTQRIPWEQVNLPPVLPRARNPLLAPRLDRVVLSALHPDPAQRPATAVRLLAEIADEEAEPAHRTTALPRDRAATATVAAIPPPDGTRAMESTRPTATAARQSSDNASSTDAVEMPEIPSQQAVTGRHTFTVPVLAALTVVVLLSAVVLGTLLVRRNNTLTMQQNHYITAEAALGRGDYDIAIAEFGAAGAYRDAPARTEAARAEKEQFASYDAGVAAFGQEDYPTAADAFGKAGFYRDAPQRRADALRLADQKQAYTEGRNDLAREDYPAAATAFARAGTYGDAPRQALQAQTLIGQQQQYNAGQDAVTRQDYSTAAAAFRAAGNFKDAPTQAMRAEQLRTQKTAYDAASAAYAREDFKTAKQQFEAAGNYQDAPARAAQADQEETLLVKYNSAQASLKASQWKDAYATLQEIAKVRPDYKDVSAVIGHLETDVVNPTPVDTSVFFNQRNGYTEAWVPVNNLIGQPVTWLYIQSRLAADARPDQISAISLSLVAKEKSTSLLNGDIPILATSSDLRDKNTLRAGEKLFVATGKGQTFDAPEFGKYRLRLAITDAVIQPRTGSGDTAGPSIPVFSRLTFDVTLATKSG